MSGEFLYPQYKPRNNVLFLADVVRALKTPAPESVFPLPETVIYPRGRPLRNFKHGEFAGLPEAGKSTLLSLFSERYYSFPNPLIVQPEFDMRPRIDISKPVRSDLVEDPQDRYLLNQVLKMGSLATGLLKLAQMAENQKEGDRKPMLLVERGANDLLSLDKSVMESFDKPSGLFLLMDVLNPLISKDIDFIVLMTIGFREAVRRRVARGKPKFSEWVNPDSWPYLELGYSWWLNTMYPLIRRQWGTGLLVLNGENDTDTSLKKLEKYTDMINLIL